MIMLRSFALLILTVAVSSSGAFAEKVFRYSEDGAPNNMDPVQSAVIYSNLIVTSVYDTLYEYKYLKRPYELKPRLAVDFPKVSKDGLTFTIQIHKGVKFMDDPAFPGGKGREVKAQDVVYSLKRHFDPKNRSQGAWLWQGKIAGLDEWKAAGSDYKKEVEGLKALDDYTLQIKVKKPFPQLLYTLEMGYAAVVPREAVEKYGQELAVHPVGSGPWIMKSHNSKKTVLVKNPNYRKETFDIKAEGYNDKEHGFTGIKELDGKTVPLVDTVEVHWMQQPIARWNSFRKGNEVVWTVLQNEQIDEVLSSKNPVKLRPEFDKQYHYRVDTEAGFVFTNFNMDDPQIGYNKDPKRQEQNKALRCAVRSAFNWRQRIDRFYLGLGEPFPGVIPPGVDGFDPKADRTSVTFDLAKAKKLLADNGWNAQNLPELRYSGVADVRNKQFFEQFRGWMIALGYPKGKIKLKEYATFGDYNKAIKDRKEMLVAMGWGLDYPDAENTLGLFYGPNQSPGSNNSNYDNPEYNKLFEEATQMLPSPQRTEKYKKLNMMMTDDCAAISGFARTKVFMWHKNAIFWPNRDILSNMLKFVDIK